MKINTCQPIAGYPILQIRDLFKWRSTLCRENIEDKLKISTPRAAKLLKELVQLGYLELMPSDFPEEKGRWFELTPAGRTLALARAVPAMQRAKAEKLLAEFLDRVREVNASADFLYKVDKVVVFGSFLRPEVAELNDLDVAVELTSKFANGDQRRAASDALVAKAYAAGRSFSGFMDELMYPYNMVKTFLRNRSRYISLHTTDDEVLTLTETRQVFPIPI
ncbi:MAG TPA: nucleotidyltransferase domain-containing protein [Hymenobacter sp.]|uniref:nucleotidyltransferase domain-containing protein n=1 Tax=Hymenobacter sp. TaxID=1898978 RepID=UPI002D80FC49|nr:nucleotidyltransferase domain-containing protein [Hymenobacter sp.]HET9505245.1 nucleotidyltransferase domain-containing protein [Hymenobacter sp.]